MKNRLRLYTRLKGNPRLDGERPRGEVFRAVALGVNLQGPVKKCDVSWDEITLKAKAEGFVWSQVTQLHVCLAGIYTRVGKHWNYCFLRYCRVNYACGSLSSTQHSCCFEHSLDRALSLHCEMVSNDFVWRQRRRKKKAKEEKLICGASIWPESKWVGSLDGTT